MAVGVKPQGASVGVDDIRRRQTTGVDAQQSKLQAQRRKQMDGFVKMVVSAAKNPIPGEENNSSQNMMQLASLMGQAQMFDGMQESLDDLSRSLRQNLVIKYQNMVGQTVQVDNSTQTYNGKPINFTYNLDFETSKLPSGAVIATVVSVSDEKGRKVYEGAGKKTPGAHELVWDGYDRKGQEVPQGGEYRVNVDCSYTHFQNGNEIHEEIRAHSSTEGVVEEVISEGSAAYLMVGGQKVSPDNITAIRDSAHVEDDVKQLIRMTPAQATVLLEKEVTIEPNKVELISGSGELNFIMDKAHKRSDVKVEFIDNAGRVVSVAQHQFPALKEGVNSFAWNGEKARSIADIERARASHEALPLMDDGIYRYKVYIADDAGKYQLIPNILEDATVTAIEADSMGNALLQCKGVLYDSAWVSRVAPVADINSDDWVEEGRKYLGRTCSFDSFMDYQAGAVAEIGFNLGILADNTKNYTAARVEIKDESGSIVRTMDIDQEYLLSHLPAYDNLTDVSQTVVDNAIAALGIKNAAGDYLNSYPLLSNEGGVHAQQAEVILEQELRAGNVQTTTQLNAGTEAHQYNQFSWDGQTDLGTAVPSGRYYYSIAYSVNNAHAGIIDTVAATIGGFDHDANGLRLQTSTGHILRISDIKGFVG